MKTTVIFLIFIELNLIFGSCPNNCNNHGTCSGTTCTCTESWIGDDCSIRLETLQSGIQKSGSVDRWSWSFYVVSNAISGGGIRVDIDPPETGINGDCDIFIRRGSLPTSTKWDKANIDWGTKASLVVENAGADRYYIGVYANFLKCDFFIKATITGDCPNGCGSHGHCATVSNVPMCVCDSGYSGSTCSDEVQIIRLNLENTGHVNKNEWKYYYLNLVDNVTQLIVSVNITNSSPELHDCDLYIKLNQIPSFVVWDYKDSSTQLKYDISIPSPLKGKWYLGFWGYKECDFKLTLKTVKGDCAYCSKHGVCLPPCQCQSDYSGDYCETKKTPLITGESVVGYVGQNLWNYYKYQSTSLQTNIVIGVQQDPLPVNADCDLYVKSGMSPTRFSFEYLEISRSPSYNLVISDALHDVLFIGVYGWYPCSYSLNITETQKCADGCGHGNCTNQGICVCDAGWFGSSCGQQGDSLQSGVKYTSQIYNANDWKYYYFRATTTNTLIVSLKETGLQSANSGLLYLFIREDTAPTLREYDYTDVDFNKGFHSITIPLEDRTESSDWIIGVYGSASVVNGQGVPFEIVAWQPNS